MLRIGIIPVIISLCVVFYGLSTTVATQASPRQGADGGSPTLQVETGLVVNAGEQVVVRMAYQSNGSGVASMAFSLDLDESCLTYAAHVIKAPNSFFAELFVDAGDSDGELDILIASFNALADQTALLTITFTTSCQPSAGNQQTAAISFANNIEFRNVTGHLVNGSATGSTITINGAPDPTATSTNTPTPTPTVVPATNTPTATPTTTQPTATATGTPVATTTNTPTATVLPSQTATSTPVATATATQPATATTTATATTGVSSTPTASPTAAAPTATATGSTTPLPTSTATATPVSVTATTTATAPATNTATAEATEPPLTTPTVTPTPTLTVTPTATPTPQTIIASITLTRTEAGVLLSWTTGQEIDSQGFYVFRAAFTTTLGVQQAAYLAEITDEFIPLTGLIPSKGSAGGAYTFLDETADPKITYAYLLVERKVDDTYIEYRQSLIVIGQEFENPYLFYLPLLVR